MRTFARRVSRICGYSAPQLDGAPILARAHPFPLDECYRLRHTTMMQKLLLLLLLASPLAWASDAKHSDFFYQPDEGRHTFEAGASYGPSKVTFLIDEPSPGELKLEAPALRYKLSYEYGLLDDLSLGVGGEFFSVTIKKEGSEDETTTSWREFEVRARSYTDWGDDRLYYGLSFFITPGDKKKENNFEGRHAIKPYIGYQTGSDLVFGGEIAFRYRLKGTKIDSPSGIPLSLEGQHEISGEAFGELTLGAGSLGASVKYWYTTAHQYQDVAGSSTVFDLDDLGFSTFLAAIYGTIPLTENLELLPRFTYQTRLSEANQDTIVFGNPTVNRLQSWTASGQLLLRLKI